MNKYDALRINYIIEAGLKTVEELAGKEGISTREATQRVTAAAMLGVGPKLYRDEINALDVLAKEGRTSGLDPEGKSGGCERKG